MSLLNCQRAEGKLSADVTSTRNCVWMLRHLRVSGQLDVPVLHYLLPDHLDVFKALHAADVVHQDVSVGIPNPPAAQVQPLLK